MMLDAQAFQTVLTPEAALGIIQKTVAQKGWKKSEVTDIKLIYSPYWLFSFDVIAVQGPSPSGKTALNAYTGDLNDFVPILFERPLKKTRTTAEGVEAEVEPTSIDPREAKSVAQSKVAAHVGLKPENISVSAFTKYYIPFYRIWIDVAGDSYKIDVDACLGAPLGLEQVPERPKTWEEATGETLQKLKTPKGWAELSGKALGAGGTAAASGGGEGGIAGSKLPLKYLAFGAIVIVLAVLVLSRQFGSAGISCKVYDDFLGAPPFLGFGEPELEPRVARNGLLYVEGECALSNSGSGDASVSVQTRVKRKTTPEILAVNLTMAPQLKPTGSTPVIKPFIVSWKGDKDGDYKFEYEKLG
ncbi:hypothetical protein H0N96_01280 [Candidatus Micrarchaeota archaeon]|nr:hypothetical protein [Candidatus Micrarchaeota archaeon]